MPTPEEEKKKKGSETTADTAPTSASEVKAQEKENLETATAEATPVETPVEQTEETNAEAVQGLVKTQDKLDETESHPERTESYSGSQKQPIYDTPEKIDEAGKKMMEDEPYLHSFLATHDEPTAPDKYDDRKEKALRWQQGIIALGKMAGIIGDTVTASKRGVVTDKKDSQGKEEMDAVGTQIKSLRDAYNARYKTYLDAQTLYRKGKQAAIDQDIKGRLELQKKLMGQNASTAYSFSRGFDANTIAKIRAWSHGQNKRTLANGQPDKNSVPISVGGPGRGIIVGKQSLNQVMSDIASYFLEDLEDMKNTIPADYLVSVLKNTFKLPDINVDKNASQEEYAEWLRLKLNDADFKATVQSKLADMFIKDITKGSNNFLLSKYMRNTSNEELFRQLEWHHNQYTGNKDYGWLSKDGTDVDRRRQAIAEYWSNLHPFNGTYTLVAPSGGVVASANDRLSIDSWLKHQDKDSILAIYAELFPNQPTPPSYEVPSATEGSQTSGQNTQQPQGQQTEKKEEKKETPTENKKESKSVTGEDLAKNLPSAKIKPQNDLSVSTFYRFLKRIKESANGDKAKFAQAFREKYKDATDAEINYAFGLNINN